MGNKEEKSKYKKTSSSKALKQFYALVAKLEGGGTFKDLMANVPLRQFIKLLIMSVEKGYLSAKHADFMGGGKL